MKIESSAFKNGELIPSRYTCDADNVSPPLLISDVPAGSKSLALIMDDPDAPGGTWVHWTVWNIDTETSEIAEASLPENAIEGTTSFGVPGYGGPCPPSGIHRYFFKLYALDTLLQLPPETTIDGLEKVMNGHTIAEASYMGRYNREKE